MIQDRKPTATLVIRHLASQTHRPRDSLCTAKPKNEMQELLHASLQSLGEEVGRKVQVDFSMIVKFAEGNKTKKRGEACLWNVSYPSGLEEQIRLREDEDSG